MAERLGPQALTNLGYSANTASQFPNKSVPRLPEWRAKADPILGVDLAFHRPINVGNVRGGGREFGGEKAVDGKDDTYWATDDGAERRTLEVDMEGPVEIDALEIGEDRDTRRRR